MNVAVHPIRGLSLCAGIGGLDLGLKLALGDAYRTVCAVEIEVFAAAVLVARQQDGSLDAFPIWDDLYSFNGRPWRGVVDIVLAGFPCQPWSVAGKRAGTADERWLWPAIAGIIRDVRPRFVFLENVPGLITGGGLELVLSDLAEMGFAAEWGCFTAAEVGASQLRERVFILAYRNGGPWDIADSSVEGRRSAVVDAIAGSAASRGDSGRSRATGCSDALLYGTQCDHEWIGGTWRLRSGPQNTTLAYAERSKRRTDQYAGNVAHGHDSGRQEAADRPRERGETLVDATQQHEREPDHKASAIARHDARAGASGRSGGVGDADITRPQGRHEPIGERTDERATRKASATMGDAESGGRLQAERGQAASIGPFPPRPSDAAGWAAVLERWPELAPALANTASGTRHVKQGQGQDISNESGIYGAEADSGGTPQSSLRGLADGAASGLGEPRYRVDQLRALGNAVVPQCAAFAFRVLAERAGVDL